MGICWSISATMCCIVTKQEVDGIVQLRKCRRTQEPRKCVRSTPGKAEEAMVAQGASPMGSVGLNWHQGIAKQTGDMLPVPLALPGLSQSPLL